MHGRSVLRSVSDLSLLMFIFTLKEEEEEDDELMLNVLRCHLTY